jgi:uncharacterized protein YceK
MKKVMCVLAVVALMVGCASNRNSGGTSDLPEKYSGMDYSTQATPNIINKGNSP